MSVFPKNQFFQFFGWEKPLVKDQDSNFWRKLLPEIPTGEEKICGKNQHRELVLEELR